MAGHRHRDADHLGRDVEITRGIEHRRKLRNSLACLAPIRPDTTPDSDSSSGRSGPVSKGRQIDDLVAKHADLFDLAFDCVAGQTISGGRAESGQALPGPAQLGIR